MSTDSPFDGGLQPERTLLAWRRTALALAAVSAVEVRLVAASWGIVAVAIGMLGLAIAATVYASSTTRYRRIHRSLVETRSLGASDGAPIAALSIGAVLVVLVAAAWVVMGGPAWRA